MNHLYFAEEKVRSFTRALVNSVPFANGTFTLYRDVPVQSLEYDGLCFRSARNPDTMDLHTALQTVDFLVCKDERPVLGLTFDFDIRESKHLFGTVLRGLSHMAVRSSDFKREDFDTDRLLQRVLKRLSELPVSEYILSLHSVFRAYYIPELQRMKLLSPYGTATFYGRDCGIVFCCEADEDGGLAEIPVVAGKGWRMYRSAIDYAPTEPAELLPQLLNSSLQDLFEYHPQELQQLTQLLPADNPLGTFADCLKLLKKLTGQKDAAETCRQLRRCINSVLCFVGREIDFPVLGQTLEVFCQEVARYTNSHYPVWVYQRRLVPYLNSLWHYYVSFPAVLRYAVDYRVLNLEHELIDLLLFCCRED